MKREFLKEQGLTDDKQIDAIMAAHGKELEKIKSDADAATATGTALQAQLAEANKKIQDFTAMDPEKIKKEAADWKTKAEQTQKDADEQVKKLKFDHALDGALAAAKAKDPIAVRAHLKSDKLQLGEDGVLIGLNEQIEPLKKSHAFLFTPDTPAPEFVAGGGNHSVIGDAVIDATRKAGGLPPAK